MDEERATAALDKAGIDYTLVLRGPIRGRRSARALSAHTLRHDNAQAATSRPPLLGG